MVAVLFERRRNYYEANLRRKAMKKRGSALSDEQIEGADGWEEHVVVTHYLRLVAATYLQRKELRVRSKRLLAFIFYAFRAIGKFRRMASKYRIRKAMRVSPNLSSKTNRP